MYAECPHCQALYRITQAELDAAGGWVRCGECGQIFEAGNTLSTPHEPTPPLVDSPRNGDLFGEPAADDDNGIDFDLGDVEEPAAAYAHDEEDMPPTKPRRRSGRLGTLLWSFIILLLIALLGLQYVYSQRDQFAKYPELRPMLSRLCEVAGCKLPPLVDLPAIALTSRNIFTHPNIPHALMVTATIVNQAPFPQPYPTLQISFSNLEGKTIALGRFTPAQYLPKSIDPHSLMPVDRPIDLSFTVNDPGQQALAYEFSFEPSR